MNRPFKIALVPIAISGALVIAACGGSSDSDSGAPATQAPAPSTPPATQPADGTAASQADGGREQASQAAVAFVENETGVDARTTGIFAEDDGGARWEIEVTTADNQEYDVLVDSSGQVIGSTAMGPG